MRISSLIGIQCLSSHRSLVTKDFSPVSFTDSRVIFFMCVCVYICFVVYVYICFICFCHKVVSLRLTFVKVSMSTAVLKTGIHMFIPDLISFIKGSESVISFSFFNKLFCDFQFCLPFHPLTVSQIPFRLPNVQFTSTSSLDNEGPLSEGLTDLTNFLFLFFLSYSPFTPPVSYFPQQT